MPQKKKKAKKKVPTRRPRRKYNTNTDLLKTTLSRENFTWALWAATGGVTEQSARNIAAGIQIPSVIVGVRLCRALGLDPGHVWTDITKR